AGLCLFSLVALALLALATRVSRRWPIAGGALLLAIHAAFQLFFLRPLYPSDEMGPYLARPRALDFVPAGSRVVHGSFLNLMRFAQIDAGDFPAPRTLWLERRAFAELYPFTGPMHGLRYELNVSPEGLDSFLTRMAQGGIRPAKDKDRVRLLAAWGVTRLLLGDRLAPEAAPGVRLLAEIPSFGRKLTIYEIRNPSPPAFLAGRLIPAPHMNAGYAHLIDPTFDPRRDVVIEGEGKPRPAGGGRVRILRDEGERFSAEIDAHGPGVLVVQRASLPIYR